MNRVFRLALIFLGTSYGITPGFVAAQTTEAPSPSQIRSRLAAMASEESDRSTPDRAMRSYFLHLNNMSERSCLRSELSRLVSGIGEFPLTEFERFADASKNVFFTDLAARAVSRFDNPRGYSECMQSRESYSYMILGVENLAAERVRYAVQATNTSPIPPQAPQDSIGRQMRAEGTQLRYEFRRVGNEWRIAQIEEHLRYGAGWHPVFSESSLLPLVPSMVPHYPY